MEKTKFKAWIKSHFPRVEDSMLDVFINHAQWVQYPKGTQLIAEGNRHPYSYFLIKGSVKSFYLKDGKSVCLWFAFENELVGTLKAMEGAPSRETVELLEDSEFIRLNNETLLRLAEKDLAFSHLVSQLILEHADFLEERLYQLQFMTSKERYEALLKLAPEVLQKVSLTDIASYLGVSRETLSRIRSQK